MALQLSSTTYDSDFFWPSNSGHVFASADNNFLLSNPVSVGDQSISSINSSNTFFTKGLISTVLFQNFTQSEQDVLNTIKLFDSKDNNVTYGDISLFHSLPKIASGIWTLNVTGGHVIDFHSDFKLVTTNGMEKLHMEIFNFESKEPVKFRPLSYTQIKGVADIRINDQLFESAFPIDLKIFKINTLIIEIQNNYINDILHNNSLLGISDSFKNYRNDELLVFNDQ